ncbi:MAG: hypothetical protein PWR29_789 [Methanolobus sp.]|nr:hypothetical protein [Methanolobus sp.]MDK2835139.1 hypothetical protein [Methanolobus sp.]MDK2911832.1 hypothetical protein [Methanolobus sp.]
MKQDLVRILKDIFTSAGYSAVDSYQHDLVAEKNGQKTYIKFANHSDIAEVNSFIDMFNDGEGLYVITGKVDRDLLQHAQNAGLRVWSRDDVALQIGKAVLADIEGSAGELDLLGEPVKRTVSKVDEVAQMAINAIFGSGSVKEEFLEPESSLMARMSQRSERTVEREPEWMQQRLMQRAPERVSERYAERAPERVPVESPAVMQEPPAPALSPDSIVLNLRGTPLNVSKDHALSIAKPHIHTYQDAILKLVPFWQYDYQLKSEQRYRSKIVDISGEGSGCLNALNGHSEDLVLHDVRDSIAIPDVAYELRQSVSTKDEARKNMLARIIDEHTKDLRFDNTQGDAIISEHKRFKPLLSDIHLNIDLVYVPIWEVKGPRNSIEINGYTAEILRNPVDDDAEFV